MEHTEIRRRLSDYLDNAVSAKEKSAIDAHLAACGTCRAALADLQRTIAHMKTLPEVEPPPWLTVKIMTRVKESAETKPAFWKRLFFPLHVKLPLEAIALLFICVTGYYLARTTAPQMPLTDTPTISREEAPLPPVIPSPKRLPSAPSAASPPSPPAEAPATSGSPASAPPRAAERGGYAPQPPVTSPVQPAPSPVAPAYQVPLSGSGAAARRSKAEMPQAEMMRDAAPFRESEMMEMRKGAREELKALEGVRQYEGASGRLPAEVMEKSVPPAAPSKYRSEPAEKGREAVEIVLRVDEPAGAIGAIEDAVIRTGGTIVRRMYGDTGHELLARTEVRGIPALVARLERIGVLRQQIQAREQDGEMVELRIRW